MDTKTLRLMTPKELDRLYAQGTAAMPQGRSRGTVLWFVNGKLRRFTSQFASFIWRGKNFSGKTLVNNFLGLCVISAQVYPGKSMYDKKPAVILDYSASKIASVKKVMDEIRNVGSRLYLGRAYSKKKFVLYFVLEFKKRE